MWRFLILLALLFLPAAMGYTQTVKQRVGKLEKRVTKNEKRIKALEKNTGKALAASKQASKKNSENLKNPIVTYFISADNRTSGSKMGMVVTLVVENSVSKPIYAFSGDFIFWDSNGKAFFRQSYVQSDALYGYKRHRVLIPVDSSKNTKAYLRLVRDKKIKVKLINQKIYY